MPDILEQKNRIARKEHTCSYCNGKIEKGKEYEYAKLVYEGRLYEWKNHLDCGFVARELWAYIDPAEGMTEEDFQEGCREFCNVFICPECKDFDEVTEECDSEDAFCLDKIAEKLRTHDFKRVKSERGWSDRWQCVPKGGDISE
jgi:hypothetical protein